MNYRERTDALKKRLKKEALDGLLVTKKENVRYLSGLDAPGSNLIITADESDYIITDSRYEELAAGNFHRFKTMLIDGSRYKLINSIAKKEKMRCLGFESDWTTVTELAGLKKYVSRARLIPKRDFIEDLRIIKDGDEIFLIKKSVEVLKKAYLFAKENISPDKTGKDLAAAIDGFIRTHGSDGLPFQTIVAQEPHSSHPHAAATEKPFGKNASILMDIGATCGGYNSDLTRIIFLGRITSKFKHIYAIIKTAQRKAIDKIAPGRKIVDIDREARGYIEKKGFGKFFLHSLGHGVGLEIHESPRIAKNGKAALEPGMVFTVEPGVYIRGWGGVRLEDMVAVTEKGCEVLTDDIPK